MREYIRPTMQGEMFAANEYVTSCWYIACDYGEENHRDPISGLLHTTNSDGTGCGWAENQVIRDLDSTSLLFSMREEDGYGEDYDVKMTRNSGYSGLSDTLSNVQVGETIYWVTSSSDGRQKWYHKGQVETTTNVNRS